MNKRDVMLALIDPGVKSPYIPGAFFLHFDEAYHQGRGAVDKHIEYFRHTDMDLVKIQYEKLFPHLLEIVRWYTVRSCWLERDAAFQPSRSNQ